ncbi:MAG: NAD(P)H-hydrate dehydratase [Colwellia sp.]|nr:NAD(P)H-hydrate dehydratase [Colwellia sp.]
MSLSQLPIAKHNWHCAYSAKQVLQNESLVAQRQQLAMYQLMEQAGSAAFDELQRRWPDTNTILVLCGKGNNGGDGFVIARLAHLANMQVTVLLSCEVSSVKGDALCAYQNMLAAGVTEIVTANLIEQVNLFSGEVIVDALFGIGFYGSLTSPMQQLVTAVNVNAANVLSVDIPSGLCANTGLVDNSLAVIAKITVTFIVYKQGLLTGQAANFVGELILADLSLGDAFKQQIKCHHYFQQEYPLYNGVSFLTKRLNTSHKGSIGQILAVGGGVGMPGAIRLASEAALRCGAALVAVCCHQDNQALVFTGRPELMLAPTDGKQLANSPVVNKAKVLLLGPGLGQTDWSQSLFDLLVSPFVSGKKNGGLVLDADGLTLLAKTNYFCSRWVLTPHPKEAATLLGCDTATIEADRFYAVQAIAKKYGGICLLKGAGTLISDGHTVVINSTGNAGMATGGMGDVLSGIVAALILQSDNNFVATCLAVYIHGAAGDIIANRGGMIGMLASDLFVPLQRLVNQNNFILNE